MKLFTPVNNIWRGLVIAMLCTFFFALETQATHLRAGDIVAERIGCGRTFRITITVYTNTGSTVRFGGETAILNFGDGTWMYVPDVENTPRPDLDAEGTVATAQFTIDHT